ncbi:MAG TPA: type IV toxin-antitoxin system AbiEi family antitoxin domain-containing protein [Solirubrobacteraceae bacterium]|nr:type IV toxin-antitoxin system AbiEi family antitoxin domain-containing protein [Solirubrobacteraceae bacterium]
MAIERWITRPEPELSTARDVRVARLAARQHGVVSTADLLACGLDHDAISVRVKNGRLHPLHRSVYTVGHANPTQDGWYLAAVKACGEGAVLSHRSRAMLENIIRWEDRYPDVLVLGESAPQHERINGHRTSYLPARHVTTVRGIPVTTAERMLLDLAAVLPEHRLRRAVRQTLFLKLTTVRSLVEVLDGPGPMRGRKKLARILARSAAPTQSELEDVVLDLILQGGFTHPLVNEPLYLAGRQIVPDFCWPDQRLVIEADGPHHDTPFERAEDRERQAILEAHGYRVIRVTWEQAIAHPAATKRRFGEAGAPRTVDNSG